MFRYFTKHLTGYCQIFSPSKYLLSLMAQMDVRSSRPALVKPVNWYWSGSDACLSIWWYISVLFLPAIYPQVWHTDYHLTIPLFFGNGQRMLSCRSRNGGCSVFLNTQQFDTAFIKLTSRIDLWVAMVLRVAHLGHFESSVHFHNTWRIVYFGGVNFHIHSWLNSMSPSC